MNLSISPSWRRPHSTPRLSASSRAFRAATAAGVLRRVGVGGVSPALLAPLAAAFEVATRRETIVKGGARGGGGGMRTRKNGPAFAEKKQKSPVVRCALSCCCRRLERARTREETFAPAACQLMYLMKGNALLCCLNKL